MGTNVLGVYRVIRAFAACLVGEPALLSGEPAYAAEFFLVVAAARLHVRIRLSSCSAAGRMHLSDVRATSAFGC